MVEENLITVLGLLIAGGSGALTREILKNNRITLPRIENNELILGFIGAVMVGAAVGLLVDHSPITAFFAGYTGFSAVAKLLPTKFELATVTAPAQAPASIKEEIPSVSPVQSSNLTIPEIIKKATDKYGISYELALAVAKCESGLNPKARNKNTDKSIDRGLYQINSRWHPDVTEAQADDPIFAAEFFCKAVNAGNLSWWKASQKCWGSAVK